LGQLMAYDVGYPGRQQGYQPLLGCVVHLLSFLRWYSAEVDTRPEGRKDNPLTTTGRRTFGVSKRTLAPGSAAARRRARLVCMLPSSS
jgi:hypothetical protein